ncbi:hypothetical protein TrLO_g2164 [Triparma laevis f. longispina]|uniref:Uncharacterized protein n=1 Tax=Triparma laevis f. longispina TaxID=1714387 RepID=A0A9W7FT97_9STRA|nr:hypothetical protein TrLO_g2164 [Triparma laevis f. longispina]
MSSVSSASSATRRGRFSVSANDLTADPSTLVSSVSLGTAQSEPGSTQSSPGSTASEEKKRDPTPPGNGQKLTYVAAAKSNSTDVNKEAKSNSSSPTTTPVSNSNPPVNSAANNNNIANPNPGNGATPTPPSALYPAPRNILNPVPVAPAPPSDGSVNSTNTRGTDDASESGVNNNLGDSTSNLPPPQSPTTATQRKGRFAIADAKKDAQGVAGTPTKEGNNKNNKGLIVSKAILPNKGVEIDISSEFKTDKLPVVVSTPVPVTALAAPTPTQMPPTPPTQPVTTPKVSQRQLPAGALAAGAPMGKLNYFLAQVATEANQLTQTVKNLQNEAKLLREKNKELEQKFVEERKLREDAEAKLTKVRKKYDALKAVGGVSGVQKIEADAAKFEKGGQGGLLVVGVGVGANAEEQRRQQQQQQKQQQQQQDVPETAPVASNPLQAQSKVGGNVVAAAGAKSVEHKHRPSWQQAQQQQQQQQAAAALQQQQVLQQQQQQQQQQAAAALQHAQNQYQQQKQQVPHAQQVQQVQQVHQQHSHQQQQYWQQQQHSQQQQQKNAAHLRQHSSPLPSKNSSSNFEASFGGSGLNRRNSKEILNGGGGGGAVAVAGGGNVGVDLTQHDDYNITPSTLSNSQILNSSRNADNFSSNDFDPLRQRVINVVAEGGGEGGGQTIVEGGVDPFDEISMRSKS